MDSHSHTIWGLGAFIVFHDSVCLARYLLKPSMLSLKIPQIRLSDVISSPGDLTFFTPLLTDSVHNSLQRSESLLQIFNLSLPRVLAKRSVSTSPNYSRALLQGAC